MRKTRYTRLFLFWIGIPLVGLVCCAAAYYAADREKLSVSAVRSKAPGRVVMVDGGATYVEDRGTGDPIVLLHGATVAHWELQGLAGALRGRGYRTILMDFFGRGLSDRPPVRYTRSLWRDQVEDVVRAMNLGQVVLLGHSIGGAVAAAVAADDPDPIRRLVLIAPVVNGVTARAPYAVCRTPIVGPFVQRLFMYGVLEKRAVAAWRGTHRESWARRQFAQQARIRGFEHAYCSMFRTDLVGDYRATIRRAARRVPTSVILGDADDVIHVDMVRRFLRSVPRIRTYLIPGTGHMVHVEAPDPVVAAVLDSLDQEALSRGPCR